MKTTVINFRVDQNVKDDLEFEAQIKDVSLSKYVRQLVENRDNIVKPTKVVTVSI